VGGDRPSWNEKILKYKAIFRLQPFDQSTAEGRSMERYRRVGLTALTSLSAKGITALTMLVSVPLTVDYLGVERYGMWMAISSLITVLSFADLGIGNGLVNSLAEANGRDDREASIRYVSNAFIMLLGIAVLIVAVFLSIYPFVPWAVVFKVQSDLAVRELGPSILLLLFCFAVSIPLSLVERIRIGYQEGFVNSGWQTLGSVTGLLLVLVAIRFEAGLPWLVLAMAGTPVFATAGNALHQFYWRRPWLRPESTDTCQSFQYRQSVSDHPDTYCSGAGERQSDHCQGLWCRRCCRICSSAEALLAGALPAVYCCPALACIW
jgi:O-antigen/teichoic acid export membrane protein